MALLQVGDRKSTAILLKFSQRLMRKHHSLSYFPVRVLSTLCTPCGKFYCSGFLLMKKLSLEPNWSFWKLFETNTNAMSKQLHFLQTFLLYFTLDSYNFFFIFCLIPDSFLLLKKTNSKNHKTPT